MTDNDPYANLRHLDGQPVTLAEVVEDPYDELPPVAYAPDPPAVLHVPQLDQEAGDPDG